MTRAARATKSASRIRPSSLTTISCGLKTLTPHPRFVVGCSCANTSDTMVSSACTSSRVADGRRRPTTRYGLSSRGAALAIRPPKGTHTSASPRSFGPMSDSSTPTTVCGRPSSLRVAPMTCSVEPNVSTQNRWLMTATVSGSDSKIRRPKARGVPVTDMRLRVAMTARTRRGGPVPTSARVPSR